MKTNEAVLREAYKALLNLECENPYAEDNCDLYGHGFLAAKMKALVIMHPALAATATVAKAVCPKVEIELPAGDKREIKIFWRELVGDTVKLCVSIEGDAAAVAKDGGGDWPVLLNDAKVYEVMSPAAKRICSFEAMTGVLSAVEIMLRDQQATPKPEASAERPVRSAALHAIHNLKAYRAGGATFPGEAIGILERYVGSSAEQPAGEVEALAAAILALPRYADVMDLQGNFSLEYASHHENQLVYVDSIERVIRERKLAAPISEDTDSAKRWKSLHEAQAQLAKSGMSRQERVERLFPVQATASIDTPEFTNLLCRVKVADSGTPYREARAALVAYIDTRAAASRNAGVVEQMLNDAITSGTGMGISKTWVGEDGAINVERIDPASVYTTTAPDTSARDASRALPELPEFDACVGKAMSFSPAAMRAYAQQCIEARNQQGDAVDAARYRYLVDQLPCSIADDLECGIKEIGEVIDQQIENLAESRETFMAKHHAAIEQRKAKDQGGCNG